MSAADPHARSTLVIMPAFNEEEHVGTVVEQVRTTLPSATVLVIDDGSVDRTAQVAAEAGARVLSLPYNLGVGGAIRVGYRFAWRHGHDVVVHIDADGQHDPAEIEVLLAALHDADVVIGSRFAGGVDYDIGIWRRIAMRFLARRVTRISGSTLTDATSGFRASGRRAIAVFATVYPVEYLGATVEALIIAARCGLEVREVPVNMRARAAGNPSQTSFKALFYLARIVGVTLLSRFQTWPPPRTRVPEVDVVPEEDRA